MQMHLKNGDIDQWRKQVEAASDFAVSEVFSHKKPHLGSPDLAMPLQSSAQLKDHDDAYSEAQALLGDWLHSKLRLELEMDEDDDLICPAKRSSPVALDITMPTAPNYSNFDDLFNCLTEEEDTSAVNNFLQDLMEQEVLDSAMMEQLSIDVGLKRKKFRNPALTMEARHEQVRANRARREAERQRQQKKREAIQEARAEAQKKEHELEIQRKQEARREDHMLHQEMVRLRRQIKAKRSIQQLARQRERECAAGQKATSKIPQNAPAIPTSAPPHQQLDKKQQVQALLYVHNIKCLQRHLSGWFSVVLNQRIRMDKAKTVCEWKMKLRAWRAWRKLVWTKQQQREVERTAMELQAENRQYLLAVRSNKRRLLRRCLNEWHLWGRVEREQRDLLHRQEETRSKMAALITAATSGKLKPTQNPTCHAVMTTTETALQTQTGHKEYHRAYTAPSDTSVVHQQIDPGATVAAVTQPTEPWQISRQHVAPSGAEIRRALLKDRGLTSLKNLASAGSRFEHRHTVQQQIISQQRKLLKEQQDQIAQLKKEQHMMGLELEVQKTAQLFQQASSRDTRTEPTEQRASEVTEHPESPCAPQKKAVTRATCPHPVITAMEARAQQRAVRRREIEEIKKKREEKKLAEIKAADELRQREEEEEKRQAAERRREERRLEREREEERQRQLQKQQELMKMARQHYYRTLLLRRGLAPWKRLIQLRQDNMQLARRHHNLFLLKQCTLGWQHSARQSRSEKEASADQLHQHFLLRRSLSSWKRLKDWRMIQEERAERFYDIKTLRKFLKALLDFVTQERLLDWELRERAENHNSRRVLQQCLQAWRQLPSLLRREREKEERRGKLIRKVAEVLPDFCSYPS